LESKEKEGKRSQGETHYPVLASGLPIFGKTNDMLQKVIFSTTLSLAFFFGSGQALKTPPASPTQTIKQDFGISSVELTYSRPGMKGRKIFGDLVPYGKVWRTGANAITQIKFNDDVTIGGMPLKAGSYAIYTIPNQSEWEVVINKDYNSWGTEYKPEDDVLHFKVKSRKMDDAVETFTMQFFNVKPNGADLSIMWEKTAVAIPITVDVDSKVMAQIDNAMNKDSRPYFQAAAYYAENGKDLNQALAWFNKAIEQNPNAYWVYYQKANLLAKMGNKNDAKATAQKSMDLARQEKNDDYVQLNVKLLDSLK
jgi:hypothetical protein